MPVSLSILLELATRALTEEAGPDAQVDAISDYSDAFSVWQKGGMAADTGMNRAEALEELRTRHALIMKKAQELQEVTKGDLSRFKQKAKALMAYVDVFPGALKRAKTRKG